MNRVRLKYTGRNTSDLPVINQNGGSDKTGNTPLGSDRPRPDAQRPVES